MFLTDKYHALLPIHSAKGARKPAAAAAPVSRFDTALAARLASLLPLPASPLAALARLADLLAATLADAVPALSSADAADPAAVAKHLDAGVALLDACNAIAARVDRLRRRRLLSRLALHLLSSSPSSAQRARAALDDHAGAPSPPVPLPSVPFVNPPRGAGRQLTPTARVLLAVNAVSSLAATAASTILDGCTTTNLKPASFPLVLSSDLPWAEPFNALSTQLALLAAANTSEVDAVDEAVRKLTSALDHTADEAAVLAAAQEVERRTEELAALLDRLSDAVNGVFNLGLGGPSDPAAVAKHLDAGVALLDACNAIAARVDRLRRRRLLSRLALHLLSSCTSPSSAQRARAALADHGGASSPPVPLPPVPFVNPPRGAGRHLTPTARVLLAVNALSSLAAAAAATILGGGSDSSNPNPASLIPLVLSADLPWAEPFNALSTQLSLLAAANTSEVDAVDEAVRKLTSALDHTADEAAVLAAAQEVEKRTEELAALLDRLSDAVNGVFRAALRLRAAELGSFAVGPADKTRKK